jgi:hypothetical protein
LVDSTPPNEQDKTWPSTSRQKLIILKEEVNVTWGPNWNAQYDQWHVVGELEQLTIIIPKLIWVFNIKGVNQKKNWFI